MENKALPKDLDNFKNEFKTLLNKHVDLNLESVVKLFIEYPDGNLEHVYRMELSGGSIKSHTPSVDSRYYIPDVSELFVGYECELFCEDGGVYTWKKVILGTIDAHYSVIDIDKTHVIWKYSTKSNIRVPYFKIEQLKNENWIEVSDSLFQKKNYEFGKDGEHFAMRKNSWYPEATLYHGPIKSINEFRKICQFLNIQ